jgi:hypothetical protein
MTSRPCEAPPCYLLALPHTRPPHEPLHERISLLVRPQIRAKSLKAGEPGWQVLGRAGAHPLEYEVAWVAARATFQNDVMS